MIEDVGALARELPDAEVVFALVSPLGTPLDDVQDALGAALREHGYQVEVLVRISQLLDERKTAPPGERPAMRQERLMDTGTALRDQHGGDYLALMAITAINASRDRDTANNVFPQRRRAHVIRSLEHPAEVTRLRHVYGKGFFLLGVSAPRRVRRETLVRRNFQRDEADRLLDKDAAEDKKIGQQTRDTFELADAYLRVDGHGLADVRRKVERIVDLLFSCPFHPPTAEEHAMFMAYAAALRSSDLSRQVGAVVANVRGDVVASGANEPPAPHGGTYRGHGQAFTGETQETAGQDYLRGYDSNERERNEILAKVIAALVPEEHDAPDHMEPGKRAALVKKYASSEESVGEPWLG